MEEQQLQEPTTTTFQRAQACLTEIMISVCKDPKEIPEDNIHKRAHELLQDITPGFQKLLEVVNESRVESMKDLTAHPTYPDVEETLKILLTAFQDLKDPMGDIVLARLETMAQQGLKVPVGASRILVPNWETKTVTMPSMVGPQFQFMYLRKPNGRPGRGTPVMTIVKSVLKTNPDDSKVVGFGVSVVNHKDGTPRKDIGRAMAVKDMFSSKTTVRVPAGGSVSAAVLAVLVNPEYWQTSRIVATVQHNRTVQKVVGKIPGENARGYWIAKAAVKRWEAEQIRRAAAETLRLAKIIKDGEKVETPDSAPAEVPTE